MRAFRTRRILISIAALAAIAAAAAVFHYYLLPRVRARRDVRQPLKPQAPPDLENLHERYAAGVEAWKRNDFGTAVEELSSFDFGSRAVEEYRLYYLGKARQGSGDTTAARTTLGLLWAREPQAVIAEDAGGTLAALQSASGDWRAASAVYRSASRSASPRPGSGALWGAVESSFNAGDLPGMLEAAREIAIRAPASPHAGDAIAVAATIQSVKPDDPFPMTFDERLERAVNLLRDHAPDRALDELSALDSVAPSALRDAVALNRGLALNQLRRYEESNTVLEPLTAGAFKVAIPALHTASKNYRALAASINPTVTRSITTRQKIGGIKVRSGKGKTARLVTKPRLAWVKRTVQRVDLAKKAKKEELDRLATERLKDLLQVRQTSAPVRLEALNALIAQAEARSQDDYERNLVSELIKLDRYADSGLQHFWDRAWAAWARSDLKTAVELFRFISDTYANPNVRRQADYWYARTIERAGDKPAATAVYERLAAAPYEDVYALFSLARGAARVPVTTNPTHGERPDWRDLAEQSMPSELRLAHELTALSQFTDAGSEIDRNASASNQRFADALRAQKLNNDGRLVELYRTLRRAFPLIATVEQDSVPPYFLKMYYPVKYDAWIRRSAAKNAIDPYLVMALILQESYFNPSAHSPVGAMGLMQIMPATGKEVGSRLYRAFHVTRLDDPGTNIEVGTTHLGHLWSLFHGDTQLVAASYNAGQGNVLKWRRAARNKPMDEFLESIPFPETRNYVKRVTLLRSAYARIAN